MNNFNDENKLTALILCALFGIFGVHHFYCGNKKIGLLYLLTFGLLGLGWFIDLIILLKMNFTDKKRKPINNNIPIRTDYIPFEIPKDAVPLDAYLYSYRERMTDNVVKDYVVFDTETTGLEPRVDKIIEISAIKFIDNKEVDRFSMLVNPNKKIGQFITELTGIRQEDLDTQPTIEDVIPKFFEFIEDYTLIAHNAEYDIEMLASECYRSNIKLCDNKVIDTLELAKKIIPRNSIDNYKLKTLKEYLGLDNISHRALADCEVCSEVYKFYLSKQNENN
jgi:DNA polymerase III epsilon subunit family exonuclease